MGDHACYWFYVSGRVPVGKDPLAVDAKLIQKYGINVLRDIRRSPLCYAGYSISYRRGGLTRKGTTDPNWHAHVRLDRQQYLNIRAAFSEWALKASTAELAKAFSSLPIAAYAPVRRQLLLLLRTVNRIRGAGGKPPIPTEVLPLRRRVVRPRRKWPTRPLSQTTGRNQC